MILALFPPMPPENKLNYKLLLPADSVAEDAEMVTIIGCDGADKEDATWKELVVLRSRKLLHIYQLLSHGRRIYRSLIFSSDSRFALHSLQPNLEAARNPAIKYSAGNAKRRFEPFGSLNIIRTNVKINGHEVFLPPRLLQGVVPSSLLEAFYFWQGEDLLIRGYPIDHNNSWFNYFLEIDIVEGLAEISRKPIKAIVTPVAPERIVPLFLTTSLADGSSLDDDDDAVQESDAHQKERLMRLQNIVNLPEKVCKLALLS